MLSGVDGELEAPRALEHMFWTLDSGLHAPSLLRMFLRPDGIHMRQD